MRRNRRLIILACGAALTLALAAAAVVASADDDGPVEDIPNAQTAIEALPYSFTFESPPRDTRKALIIRTTDELGRSFRFFLFVDRAPLDIGVPSYHRENLDGGALGHKYVMLANDRHQMRPVTLKLPIRSYSGNSGITAAMEREYLKIAFAVEDAVCELSEGTPCPAL
jgi:hypothetical protein